MTPLLRTIACRACSLRSLRAASLLSRPPPSPSSPSSPSSSFRPLRHLSTTPPTLRDLGARYRRPRPAAAVLLTDIPPNPDSEDVWPAPPKRRDTAVEVAGVRVPPQPIPPGDEDCCMSGCVHCVLTLYAEDLELYNAAVDEARAALTKKGVPRARWPKAVTEDEEEVPVGDPGLAAFMALENKIKKKAKPADSSMAAFLALEKQIKQK